MGEAEVGFYPAIGLRSSSITSSSDAELVRPKPVLANDGVEDESREMVAPKRRKRAMKQEGACASEEMETLRK